MKEEKLLSLTINFALLQHPGLLDELPQMLHAIDEGECIAVDKISDVGKRDSITSIFRIMPILRKHPDYGWHKVDRDVSARSFLIGSLLDAGKVIEPRDLTQARQLAARAVPMNLMKLLSTYPSLRNELPILLEQIIAGNDVQLDSLGDEDLSESLERLLRSVGMIVRKNSLCIPDDEHSMVIRAIKSLQQIFDDYESFQYSSRKSKTTSGKSDDGPKSSKSKSEDSKKKRKDKKKHERRDSYSSSSASSSSSSSSTSSSSGDSDFEEDIVTLKDNSIQGSSSVEAREEAPSTIRQQGPARPSAAELEAAAKFTAQYSEEEDSNEEEDDDGFGPQVMRHSTISTGHRSSTVAIPLGFVDVDPSIADQNDGQHLTAGKKRDREAIDADNGNQNDGALKREAWILEPGESKALNGNCYCTLLTFNFFVF